MIVKENKSEKVLLKNEQVQSYLGLGETIGNQNNSNNITEEKAKKKIMNKIENTTAALLLIGIAYKEGKINERTYNNIHKKYA